MKQIKKKDLKEVIRLTKLWGDINDDISNDIGDDSALYNELSLARLKAFGKTYSPLNDIVADIYRLKDKKITLRTYYKIFEALGFELV